MSGRVTDLTARRLDVLLADEQVDGRLPSVVGGVVRDGDAGVAGTAATRPASRVAARADVQYRIGSITKTLVAVLVLQLRDEGLLDLNDRLDAHLPGIALRRPHAARPAGARHRHARRAAGRVVGAHARAARSTSWPPRSTTRAPPFDAGRDASTTRNVAYGAARRGRRPAPRRAVVRRGAGADPGAARDDPHDATCPERAARPGLQRAPLRRHARPRSRRTTPARWRRPGRCGARSRTSRATRRSWPPATTTCCRRRRSTRCAPRSRVPGRRRSASALRARLPAASAAGRACCVGHTGSMPASWPGCSSTRVRVPARWCWPTAPPGCAARGSPVDLLDTLEEREPHAAAGRGRPSARRARRRSRELLGVWHWGNTAYAFAWDGREVVGVRRSVRRRRGAPVRAADDGTLRRHPRLPPRRDAATSYAATTAASATWCARRSSTPATPYDPTAPIPGGHPHELTPSSRCATRLRCLGAAPACTASAVSWAWETVDMLKSGTRRAGVAVRGK